MKIELKKFGTTLISRQNGREAFAAFQSQLTALDENENLELDFEGVITFSPSWGDEFLSPLLKKYNERLVLINANNPSVKATLELLAKINQKPFIIR
ncbi:MAG: STAS-like domain-containing protein [Patescibacteria group bacterium]|mgnify:CR=1 FL=1